VNSPGLVASDFSASSTATQVVVTYNGRSKPFSFGSAVAVEVHFTASSQVGTGKVSFSSRFTASADVNLPHTLVSIVDFANTGVTSVAHDGTLTGNGTSGAPLGVVEGSIPIATDATLTGNGTTPMPLGIALPLVLQSSANGIIGVQIQLLGLESAGVIVSGGGVPILSAATTVASGGDAIQCHGGDGSGAGKISGRGILAIGGFGTFGATGADGVVAAGGGADGAGSPAGDGIFAQPGAALRGAVNGFAGNFNGNVQVSGNLSKSGGSFKIDHPLDPANKYLYHSFVESPDMKNIYDGTVRLDSNGEAVVALPAWFGALNKDFRYLLTPIGAPAPGLYIAEEIADNRFKISGGAPGMRVSWQVTGIRQDAWANANRIPVEELKSKLERGHYVHPDLFDQPEEKSVEWARHPETMKRMKEQREQRMGHTQTAASAAVAHPQPGSSEAPH
jgi:hypothetical protein